MSTVGAPVPKGLEPAYVAEIDGRRVAHSRRSFQLKPGTHLIRVTPYVAGPTHEVPTQDAMLAYLRNDPLALEVRAGETHYIALRVITPIDYTTRAGYWRAELAHSRGPRLRVNSR